MNLASNKNFIKVSDHPDSSCEKLVIFLPGLNLNPLAMTELAQTIPNAHVYIFRHNSKSTMSDEEQILLKAINDEYETNSNLNIYLMGFSYGSLLAIKASNKFDYIKGIIFLCPPLALRKAPLSLETFFQLLPSHLHFPSLNLPTYRQNSWLSNARFKEMRTLRRGTQKIIFNVKTPTLAFLNTKDELINLKKTKELLLKFPVPYMKIHSFTPMPDERFPAHLCIDATTLGSSEFQRISSEIVNFISQF